MSGELNPLDLTFNLEQRKCKFQTTQSMAFMKYTSQINYSSYVRYRGQTTEHDPLNNNNYIFRNIKTPNYVLFLLCVCFIYQSRMFVLLMMSHVSPMVRQ